MKGGSLPTPAKKGGNWPLGLFTGGGGGGGYLPYWYYAYEIGLHFTFVYNNNNKKKKKKIYQWFKRVLLSIQWIITLAISITKNC